jgi:hypothetical protein
MKGFVPAGFVNECPFLRKAPSPRSGKHFPLCGGVKGITFPTERELVFLSHGDSREMQVCRARLGLERLFFNLSPGVWKLHC